MTSCDQSDDSIANQPLTAAAYLAGGDTEGFLLAAEPRLFIFPADHGKHPGFRNEWWYLTGNVESESGRQFGYQVTFFANAIRSEENQHCEEENAWCTSHVWMGHAAISDVQNQQHYVNEIFSRESPGLAGVQSDPFRVWIQDWQIISTSSDFPWELEILAEDFALSLHLAPAKDPVLQGDDGLSQKNEEPGNASYYYSLTRIKTSGQISLDGELIPVSGESWLDREWSTSALSANQSGWDWFSLQLNDGTELMYYQLRDLEGKSHPYSAGKTISLMGFDWTLTNSDIVLEEIQDWIAPDGTRYTTQWRMQFGNNDWLINALFQEQLMDLTFQYWEGAVNVTDYDSGEKIGVGYLEMVRE